MKTLKRRGARLRRKLALTPEQAGQLATLKFPYC